MESEALSKIVAKAYENLDALRAAHGKPVQILLGERPLFCYHADVEIDLDHDVAKIFPEIVEEGREFFDRKTTRHHPLYQLYYLHDSRRLRLVELRLLPGETYKIYADGDYEEVVLERGDLEEYPPLSAEQVEKFMSALDIKAEREKFLALVGRY